MEKVLITGGMGFIGRALSRKLLAEYNYDLVLVDNLAMGKPDEELVANDRVTFFNTDLSIWEPAPGETYKHIYHLAGPVGPLRVIELRGRVAPIIIGQLAKIADMAVAMQAKLMFISTSEVYGTHAKEQISENVDPIVAANITPRLEYGIGKLTGEIMLKNLSTAESLAYNCVRPFNIIGPGQNPKGGFVIPRFVQFALNNEPITVYGDGCQVRTFTHIQDFLSAIVILTESDVTGEVFNVGNPGGTLPILELATRIKHALGSESEISLVDPEQLHGRPFHDAWDKIPDISKLNKAVGWSPIWTLDRIFEEVGVLRERYVR